MHVDFFFLCTFYIYILNIFVFCNNIFIFFTRINVFSSVEFITYLTLTYLITEFFPKKLRLERAQWTDNDRNMSHFFMKAYSDFARYGYANFISSFTIHILIYFCTCRNPTHTQILGLHFEMARAGELKYLNINTTYNSSIMLNYRQTECAFWTEYLPTVIGVLVPTYPPTTEVNREY